MGNIVISKIVKLGFFPLHFTVTFARTNDEYYSSLYREHRYTRIEDRYIGVPLY